MQYKALVSDVVPVAVAQTGVRIKSCVTVTEVAPLRMVALPLVSPLLASMKPFSQHVLLATRVTGAAAKFVV